MFVCIEIYYIVCIKSRIFIIRMKLGYGMTATLAVILRMRIRVIRCEPNVAVSGNLSSRKKKREWEHM